jgi:hypothetical protein
MQQITLGLSMHRPEMIPIISEYMHDHDVIILEEPPIPEFEQMLRNGVSIDEYVLVLDVEYPEFSRRLYQVLRKLHQDGKKILQIEPFLENLLEIHDFFAQDHGPDEIEKGSVQYSVYLAERNATKALLSYYQIVINGSFDETLAAIKQFARMDAARFRLRDSLRAWELASVTNKYSSSYVEAGVIHYPLWRLLRQQMTQQVQVRSIFLADAALKTIGESGHVFGPGDQLTLFYIFHPDMTGTAREDLFAARSIVYSKIVEKEELTDDLNTFPHLRDELACIRTAKQLSLDDCRRLFPLVHRTKSVDARQIVTEYLAEFKSQIRERQK